MNVCILQIKIINVENKDFILLSFLIKLERCDFMFVFIMIHLMNRLPIYFISTS